jgi:hypothetical protein
MGALNTLVREQAEACLESAVVEANKWADVGRPIILATIRMDGDVDDALRPLMADNLRTYREAARIVADARRALEEMLEGIRDDFLADQLPPQPGPGAAEDAWERRDSFADALADVVVSVRDLVKRVEREDYDAFIRGDR